MFKFIFIIVGLIFLAGCQSTPKTPPSLAQRVGEAHGIEMYNAMDGMEGDIHVIFNEGLQFDAHFSTDLTTGKTRMVLLDDTILVNDGKNCWISPATSKISNARYHLQTWPFLISLPLCIKNAGLVTQEIGKVTFGSTEYNGLQITVPNGGNAGTYTLYVDETSSFAKAATIMTSSTSPAPTTSPATQSAGYALSFYNYHLYNGVFLAQDWKIWQYSPDKGIVGMPIGEARVYNVEFLKLKDSTFVPPAGARKE